MVGIPPARIGYYTGRIARFFTGTDQPPISKAKDVGTGTVKKAYTETEQPSGGTRRQVNVGVVKVSGRKVEIQ